MNDIDFIVLKTFHGNSPLDRSGAWGFIGHKKPNYYSHHSVSDEAIDRLIEKRFLEVHWSDNAGNTEWKISDIGKEAYTSENKIRLKEARLQSRKLWQETNWVWAETIKHLISAIIGGIIGGLFVMLSDLQCNRQLKQTSNTVKMVDTSKIVR